MNGATAATNATHNTGLGFAERHDLFGASGGVLEGVAVDASAVLIRYTYYGDTDLNGVINFDDYARVDSGFNNHGTDWFHGDFDYNGHVDFDDYALIDLAFNTQGGVLSSPVPEPGFASAALGFAVWIGRRRVAEFGKTEAPEFSTDMKGAL